MWASLLQVVVTQVRGDRPEMVELVAEVNHSHNDTMLAQCPDGLKVCSAHAVEARGSPLGRSPLCLKLDRILCIMHFTRTLACS